nr:hypothetical protein [Tanacetum cinerariifolium]
HLSLTGSFFIIAVQTPGSGISILLTVATPSTGSGNLYCQWELSPGSGISILLTVATPSTGSGNLYCQWELSPGRFFQIPIAPEDQEKMTFTCPYGTFAYRRMPFGLCSAPATFQRCMTAIFHDMVEDFMEVLMDDFLVFGNSFDQCLNNLDKCSVDVKKPTCAKLGKMPFYGKKGIGLGHKISKNGIEIDKAKIDVITKLPYPSNVKGCNMDFTTAEKNRFMELDELMELQDGAYENTRNLQGKNQAMEP